MRPNVLLVVLDAARRDALTPYGAPAQATPVIAELARRGHALPRAYATSSWTLPSHASLFTGLLPRTLGLAQPPGGDPRSARALLERVSGRLLPQVLSEAGYRTEGFSANLWASGHAGFDIGFDSFVYLDSERVQRSNALLDGGVRARLAWAREGLRSRGDDGAAAFGRALAASIQAWAGTPTFWFVNLTECHSPYLPPRPWNDLGPLERTRAAFDSQRHLNFESICLHAAGRGVTPAASMRRMRHLYGRSVAYMDAWLGDVLAALGARGILDDTLIILTADHGESFGEDGMVAHGFSLGEQLIHVPLVMAGPGAYAGQDVFSLARVPAVIGDAAGLSEHPWPGQDQDAGVAVAQYDGLAGEDDPRVLEFARKWDLDGAAVRRLTSSFTCATDGEHKLLLGDGEPERLYDLRADPDERTPLVPGQAGWDQRSAAIADRLRGALAEAEMNSSGIGLGPVEATASGPAASPAELAAIEQQMKLLGYM